MTAEEAIAKLDAIDSDPEDAHGQADDILLALVGVDVAAAFQRAADRHGGFWYS